MKKSLTKILLLLLLLVCDNQAAYDLIKDRGILIRNETTYNAKFFSSISTQTTIVHIPQPRFPTSYRFKNSCSHLNHNVHNYTVIMNQALDQTIRTRLKQHIFGTNYEPKPPSTASPTTSTGLDYRGLPKSLFLPPSEASKSLSAVYNYFPSNVKVSSLKTSMKNVQNLGTTRLGQYVGLDCSKIVHTITFTAIEPLKAIALIIRANPTIQYDLKYDFKLQTKLKTRANTNFCSDRQVYARHTTYPVAVWSCSWEGTNPVKVEIFLNTQSKAICEQFRISKILVFPVINDVKRRNRRQTGLVLAGAAAAGSFIYTQIAKFFRTDNRDIEAIEKVIKVEDTQNHLRDREISDLTKGIAFISNNMDQLLSTTHDEICSFEVKAEDITVSEVIRSVASEYIQSLEDMLIATLIPLEGSLPSQIAHQLCATANSLSKDQCRIFYEKREHLTISSIHFSNLEDDSEPVMATLQVKISVPVFEEYDLTVHRILSVPLPLSTSSNGKNFHFMEYESLPNWYAQFHTYDRKVSLDNCQRISTTFFCPLDKLNSLFSTDSICLNSITLQKTSCPMKEIASLTNCLIAAEQNILLISHVGDVSLQNQSKHSLQHSNILNLNQVGKRITGSNITVLTGPDSIQVTCTQARFIYRPVSNEPVIVNNRQISTDIREFPIINFSEDDIRRWEETDREISHQQSQMQHIQDDSILAEIELKKSMNNNKIGEMLNVKSTTFQNWVEFFGIIISVIVFIYLVIKLIMLTKTFWSWMWGRCCGSCCIKKQRPKTNGHTNEPAIELITRENSRKSAPGRIPNTRSVYDIASK